MDLLEYQAKALFREVGIPVLPSQCIDASRAIKQLQIPYPVVLKSQVRAAGRSQAGGVRFVENTIDAIAAAQSILDLPIGGEYPQLLLAEARYDAQQEIFLAIALDYQRQQPVLLGSVSGGNDTASRQDDLQTVAIEGEFSPFYGRRLALQMGLDSALIPAIGRTIEKMYHLFISRELNSIEINPLGISASGEVMALDGKIAANDCALGRQPDLQALLRSLPLDRASGNGQPPATDAVPGQWFAWGETTGDIAVVTNRRGLGMLTWDLLRQRHGRPTGCWALELAAPDAADELLPVLETLAATKVAAIAINILVEPAVAQAVIAAIARYLQPRTAAQAALSNEDRINRPTAVTMRTLRQRSSHRQTTASAPARPTLVLRLGSPATSASLQAEFSTLPIRWVEQSEALAETAIGVAARAVKRR